MSWDWRRRIPMWDFHGLAMSGYPGWDRDVGSNEPCHVDLTVVKGRGDSSHKMASDFDDVADGAFYWRDWTDSGLPFVSDGEAYRSRFWFASRSDLDKFKEMRGMK